MEETTVDVSVSNDQIQEWVQRIDSRELIPHTLGDETVKVLVVGTLQAQVPSADVVDGLIVNHERAVGVLKRGVSGKDGVVGLDDRGGSLRSGVDTELQLALLAVVDGQTLHDESTETRTGSTTEGVEHKETLETRAGIGDAADLVQNLVDQLLADSVVTAGVVVGGILLARDHLFGVEQAAVGAGTDFVDDIGLQVTVDGTGNVFALSYEAQNG